MVAFITFLLKFALFFLYLFPCFDLVDCLYFLQADKAYARQFNPYDQQEGTETKGNTVTDNRQTLRRSSDIRNLNNPLLPW